MQIKHTTDENFQLILAFIIDISQDPQIHEKAFKLNTPPEKIKQNC